MQKCWHHQWPKKPVIWEESGVLYASVVFSWQLKDVPKEAIVGGPAAKVAGLNTDDIPGVLWRHNPDACFTTRGCIRKCKFCAVPKAEGNFQELANINLRPIICDNNFLASSRKHFDKIIDGLKSFEGVDFNQGLDHRLLTSYHAHRLAELHTYVIRLAWDNSKDNPFPAIDLLRKAGFSKNRIRLYVLIGYDDTPDDALFRLQTLKDSGYMPNPMRYQPINTPKKNSYISANWTDGELKRYMKYWARLRYTGSIPFSEFALDKCGGKRKDFIHEVLEDD